MNRIIKTKKAGYT